MKYDELSRVEDSAEEGALRSHSSETILVHAQEQVDQILHMKTTWLAFLIVSAAILGVVLLVMIFLRSRIRIAVSLIKEASK